MRTFVYRVGPIFVLISDNIIGDLNMFKTAQYRSHCFARNTRCPAAVLELLSSFL